jgi:hypothetical protein
MGAVTAAPRTAMLCAQLLLAAVPGMSAPVIGRASRGPQPRAEGLASASAYVPQGGPRAPLMMDADGNLYRPDGVKVPTDAGGMPIAGVGAFPLLSDLHRAQHGRGSRDDAAADDGRAAAPTSLVTAAPPAAAPPVVAPGPQPQATDTSQRSRRCSRYGAAKECNQGGCYWSDDSSTCYVRHVPGSDGTYAQNYQDWWVERVARHNHWDASGGYFLDIGAHSGLWCSNTKLLEERLGWNGVCECNSAAAAAFAAAALSALIPSHTAVVSGGAGRCGALPREWPNRGLIREPDGAALRVVAVVPLSAGDVDWRCVLVVVPAVLARAACLDWHCRRKRRENGWGGRSGRCGCSPSLGTHLLLRRKQAIGYLTMLDLLTVCSR